MCSGAELAVCESQHLSVFYNFFDDSLLHFFTAACKDYGQCNVMHHVAKTGSCIALRKGTANLYMLFYTKSGASLLLRNQ